MSYKITPTALIFSLSLFVSAGLLFAIQPLTGKMMLPLVGGAPSGWVVSMAFFQIALLVGYGASYGLGRLPVIAHGMVYMGLLGVGAFFLPVGLAYDSSMDVSQSPALSVIQMLGLGIGVPFVALATSGPTLQRLYAASGSHDAHDPYYLYAASNLGSFFGLLSYPFLIEPLLALPRQSILWSLAYGGLAFLALACLVIIRGKAKKYAGTIPDTVIAEATTAVTWPQRLQWVLCAAIPTSLILGVTTKITTDLGSLPLIWIIPLSLYLLTLVMAFAKKRRYNADLFILAMPAIIALALHRDLYGIGSEQLADMLPALVCFFIICLTLHTILSNNRPAVRNLTEFYFFMSLGGAIGGSLNAFVAPLLFSWYWEYPAVLLLGLFMLPHRLLPQSKNDRRHIYAIVAASVVIFVLFFIFQNLQDNYLLDQPEKAQTIPKLIATASLLLLLAVSVYPRYLATILFVLCVGNDWVIANKALERSRSFFGISLIAEQVEKDGRTVRYYSHGTTLHGMQVRTPSISLEPTSYYTRNGPAGDYMTIDDPKEVAIIGLGAGNLLCYSSLGRRFTVYEIDQTVIDLANRWFTYTQQCTPPDFIVGDGRLKIADSKKSFDLIVIDAFSSDAIPVHLLTVEALQGYLNHLSPEGRLVLHITNRFVDLVPPITAATNHLGLHGARKLWKPSHEQEKQDIARTAHYVVLARRPELLEPFYQRGWKKIADHSDNTVWTDNYSNILPYLKKPNGNRLFAPSAQEQK